MCLCCTAGKTDAAQLSAGNAPRSTAACQSNNTQDVYELRRTLAIQCLLLTLPQASLQVLIHALTPIIVNNDCWTVTLHLHMPHLRDFACR
jgi:hypothetical protein